MSGYLNFKPTGVPEIDAILRAVEVAGDAYHHTEDWGDDDNGESHIDRIQKAADAAALARRGAAMQWRPIEEAPKDRELIGIERPPGEDRNFYRIIKWDDEKNAWVTQVDIDWSISPGRVVYAVCYGMSHFIHPDAVPLIPEELVEAGNDD